MRELFKSAQGYEYFATSSADSYSSRSLLQCVLTLLSANERSEMGLSTQEPYASFTAKIARVATEARDRSAQALGMHTLKPWFKSPMRLADGRVGYTLGGRSGHTLPDVQPQLLKHAVLELYPLRTLPSKPPQPFYLHVHLPFCCNSNNLSLVTVVPRLGTYTNSSFTISFSCFLILATAYIFLNN